MNTVRVSAFFVATTVASLCALGACSNSSGGGSSAREDAGSDAGVDPAQACADLASATCKKLQACAPLFVATSFGDVASCSARAATSCRAALAAKGTSASPAHHEACGRAIDGESCNDVFAGNTPSACAIAPGALADGAACGEDAQCASAFCGGKAAGKYCGTCASAPAAGAPCNGGRCGPSLACGANGTCVKPGGDGASCDANTPCESTLSCGGGKCATPLASGATCDPKQTTTPGCQATAGLYCNALTTKCEAVTIASTNELCGVVHGKLAFCSALGHCRIPANTVQGVCIAAAADGAACNDTSGPSCMAGAHCVNAVCTPDDPAACL